MSEYIQCPQGHYYKGDKCPYCENHGPYPYTAPFVCETCKARSDEYNGGKCPYCGGPMQGLSEDAYTQWRLNKENEAMIIPVCKHCGHRIRKKNPCYMNVIMNNRDWSNFTPWNVNWDGKCEYCGHDYNINLETPINDNGKKKNKTTFVKVDTNDSVHERYSISENGEKCIDVTRYPVLSGVTIKTQVGDVMQGEVFLCADELKRLVDLLKDSPVLKQYDYIIDTDLY